jgi:Ohr subfamily peroxiredoxin
VLDITLGVPGTSRPGTNPEQLFAAGWSACFERAIGLVAKKKQLSVAGEVTIDAEVDLNLSSTAGFSLTVRMAIHVPGVDHDVAQSLIDEAHQICPYSTATRGNIDVKFTLI